MAKDWYGRQYSTGEIIPSVCYQPIVVNKNIALKAIRLTLSVYNSPVLTGLQCHVYSNRAGAPDRLIMSSTNTWATADITSDINGIRQIYFDFDPKHLNDTETYHVCLSVSSYTGTDSSHIAWVLAFPDPVNNITTTQQIRYLGVWPQEVILVGAEL